MGDTTFKQGPTISATYTATAGTTAATTSTASKIRVVCTTAAFVKIGANPTATAADMPMTANVPEYFDVAPGDKVSAIESSADGTVYVTEMSKLS